MRYDPGFIDACIKELPLPGSTTAKGMRLQDLVDYVLGGMEGARVYDRNTHNAARSQEVDLWLQHDRRVSGLPFADLLVPIECKNEKTAASSAEVSRLETKVRDSGGSDGLLVARSGLAGPTHDKSAHDTIHVALSHGIRIIVVTGDDLNRVHDSSDLRDLLVVRYVELRLEGTYKTI
jgi:hypothetical protein